MYGIGQGFNEGVKTAGNFLFRAMQAKRDDKRFYDQLALDHAWNEGFHGRPSMLDREASLPQGGPVTSGPISYQVTRSEPSGPAAFLGRLFGKSAGPSPGESLAGKFQDPVNPTLPPRFADPVNPAPASPVPQGRPIPQAQLQPSGPRINIRPNTPLPPMWMMRRGFRRGYRGYKENHDDFAGQRIAGC